ncbi:MAG: HAD-IA family hydrolase [Planctomycetia bacterium]|nr:HAD-IA family hydrolase [Planctomycetia bacterium]
MRLLFDLDGTLTDPGSGITRCIQHALLGLNRIAPSSADLYWCVGPPLRESFATLLESSETALLERAIALYRQRFASVGMFENEVYPEIADALAELVADGHRLLVVTSKPHVYAEAILTHFKLRDMFVAVYGSELSGERCDKSILLRYMLSLEGDKEPSLMIGDRRHDIAAAHTSGLQSVGVLWGYGTYAELEQAGARKIVASVAELLEWIAVQQALAHARP